MGVLDLVGLAVDVHQSAQLYQAREQLQRLERGALQESARKQVLDSLRHLVFTVGQNLKTLDQYLENTPQPVYVAAKSLIERFREIGITPEVFPEFADKEYVQQVREKLENIVQRAQNMLTDQQLYQANECFKAIVEMPRLDQAIEARTALTQIEATNHQWQELERKTKKVRVAGILFVVGSLFVFQYAPLLTLILLIIGIVLLVRKSDDHNRIQYERAKWQPKIPNEVILHQYEVSFGGRGTDYKKLRREREQLLQVVMGQIQGFGNLLPSASTNSSSVLTAINPVIAPSNVAHIISGSNGSWMCSNCGGYIRRDATLCKHCKAKF